MLITIFILVWLLVSAWLTVLGFGRDLGFTNIKSWLWTIHSCLFAPITLAIIQPIKDIKLEREIKQKLKRKE